MPQLMTLDYTTVYEVCKAFYNLSTTEFKIVELLAECGRRTRFIKAFEDLLHTDYSRS